MIWYQVFTISIAPPSGYYVGVLLFVFGLESQLPRSDSIKKAVDDEVQKSLILIEERKAALQAFDLEKAWALAIRHGEIPGLVDVLSAKLKTLKAMNRNMFSCPILPKKYWHIPAISLLWRPRKMM